ncbi:ankyrin repeat domain-containing protein 54-like [Penaeus chinensis]|uniref:ankyrin repeat domain-containing protein 54-like n=1 Tax=Penaeus chinensis TaxID=139456 RepID=UPI001FB708C4|nr:ankyrin repeat domain-containing protein 54-like [Penaeus chinensis]
MVQVTGPTPVSWCDRWQYQDLEDPIYRRTVSPRKLPKSWILVLVQQTSRPKDFASLLNASRVSETKVHHPESTEKRLRVKKMDPESRTKNLHLYLAILLGDVKELQNCIASGADIAVADKFGDTFLHYVAKLGHCRAARVLLEARVDPNASNGAGQTPLHYAARAGNEKIVRILLKNGAHMRVLDQGSHTPLHIASQRQRVKAASVLYKNKTTETKIYRPKRLNAMVVNAKMKFS